MPYLFLILGSYLIGAVPTSYIVGKLYKGIDLRQYGSGNLGTTNTLRVLGKFPAIIVLILDVCKGVAAVYLGRALIGTNLAEVVAGFIVILGHNKSVFVNFKGGRGVATGAGVILTLTPKVTLICVLIWVTVIVLTRYVSLGSIIAAAFAAPLMWFFGDPIEYIGFGLIAATFVIIRHRDNVKRLLAGNEYKLGQKAK